MKKFIFLILLVPVFILTEAQESKVRESKAQESKAQESKAQESKVQESKVQESKVQESKVQESKVQESKVQESKVQESKVQESKAQESKAQESKAQESKGQESKAQESKVQEPEVRVPAVQVSATEVPQGQMSKMPSLTEMLKKNIDDAHEGLEQALDLLKNIRTYMRQASFTDSLSIAIEKEGEGGIWFDFGYRGHGLVNQPFTGFKTKIDFVKVPDWLETVFKNTLIKLGFGRIINVSPEDEFLIKFILLSSDKKNKKINSRQFVTEFFFILYRLALVKDFPGIDSLLKDTTGPFADLIGKIRINNKPVKDFLNEYWKNFKLVVNYDFAIENKAAFELKKTDLIETNDWKTILKISFAICLKTAVEYYAAREKFVQTPNGKQLLDQIKLSQTKKEKFAKLRAFNEAMPEYNKIVTDIRSRLKGFLRRIKGVRSFINKFREKLSPILSPFFEAIGLSLDLVWPKLEDVEDTTKLYEGEEFVFEEDFGDDVFGAGGFDFTEF